ncbi:DUF4395 domain-containing protein [Mycetocola saprophilus]|uniref:DUF4395 domain-containing protein n=1 Tax=Mycetocola saprophilus TaxID=76636 RepID=UPI003BF35CE6
MSAAENLVRPGPPPGTVDPRAPRVGAAITSVLLIIGVFLSLIGTSTGGNLGGLSLGQRVADPGFLMQLVVAVLFAWSLIAPASQPLTVIFRRLVRPRLAPPTEWEDARPPRFAQAVGLTVVGIGLLLHLIGVPWALVIAGSAAFIAAFLNAAIGFCLGCEIYLLLVRAGLIGRGQRAAV